MGPSGCRVHQDELSNEVAIPRRSLARLLKRLEELAIIRVTRTTTDGAFGSPRGPNIYRILVSEAKWSERVEHVTARRVIASRRLRSVAQQRSDALAGSTKLATSRGSALEPYEPPQDEIEALAATYSHDDLAGW
jgi:hypothetical protein